MSRLLILAAVVTLSGCEPRGVPDFDRSAARYTLSTHDAAFMTGSADVLREVWYPGAVLYPPGAAPVRGRVAVARWLVENVEDSRLGIAHIDSVWQDGREAHIRFGGGKASLLLHTDNYGWKPSELRWEPSFSPLVMAEP